MIEGKKVSAMLPRSWKKTINSGVIIPEKMRFCNECNDKKMCINCNNQSNENKEFDANLNEVKVKDTHPKNLVICFLIIKYKYFEKIVIFKNMIEDLKIFLKKNFRNIT